MATPSGNSFKILQLSLGARLRAIGGLEQGQLVAGPWGDLSSDLHLLLWLFAEQRCAAMGRARGWEGDPDVLLAKSDGRGSALYECDSGKSSGFLPAGEVVPTPARAAAQRAFVP